MSDAPSWVATRGGWTKPAECIHGEENELETFFCAAQTEVDRDECSCRNERFAVRYA
jgi:hypothetical protein